MVRSMSQAKNHFNSIVSSGKTTFLTKNGKTIATILSYELYQEMYKAWKDLQYNEAIELAKRIEEGDHVELVSDEELQVMLAVGTGD